MKILSIDEDFCMRLGYEEKECIGANFDMLIDDNSKKLLIDFWKENIQEEKNYFKCNFISKIGAIIEY